jgi:hypothetical protein
MRLLCHIIVLDVHASPGDKTDYVKVSLHEELEPVFNKFPKYHTKILLGDFNAEVGKPTTVNKSLHEISNHNGAKAVNVAISKNLTVKSIVFSHHNIHIHTHLSLADWPLSLCCLCVIITAR